MSKGIENSTVKDFIDKMRTSSGTDKGVWGERAVLRLLLDLYRERGGILIHSYEYDTDPTKGGNIKNENGRVYMERLGSATEIDILYISQYRVFPIEVKSYAADQITLTTQGISGCATTNKSPVHQNEMHCNHLYSHIAEGINGNPQFIVPIVCFCTWENKPVINDNRPEDERGYILTCNINTLLDTIKACDTPLGYRLNLDQMDRMLRRVMKSSDAYYPVQWR